MSGYPRLSQNRLEQVRAELVRQHYLSRPIDPRHHVFDQPPVPEFPVWPAVAYACCGMLTTVVFLVLSIVYLSL